MKYKNAEKGLGTLCAAQIIFLLSTLAEFAVVLILRLSVSSDSISTVAGNPILLLSAIHIDPEYLPIAIISALHFFIAAVVAAIALRICSIVISIRGYAEAIKDDKEFKKALFYVILYCGSIILNFFISDNLPAQTTVIVVGEVFLLFSMINALLGTKSIAEKKGDQTFVRKNRIMNVFISAFCVIAAVADVLSIVFYDYRLSAALIFDILLLGRAALIVSSALFFIHLDQARKIIRA